ncbi:hypothetical protein GJW-30_1_03392 [Variibacter gotjawalensis]|uniref:Uncharacterized protein n=1 Tax=Variibacter gotjawalensis TaxID=1333996 RepID=A0A0S3PY13_9BRAD|nr:hypothetical protein [Variibacter gotjawalensis]NIK46677.1 hypothetical protein [Variibacter gotjawalensis]RZS48580.1 hypothetical protein EV661_0995 [Variibacter gotjawalensis]BAT60842.1 hypothetical protein GJW-30_1_03392 [Variibacter gotjawalensis]
MKYAVAVALLFAALTSAHAEDDRRCVDSHIDQDPSTLQLGRIAGDEKRKYFFAGSDRAPECPAATVGCIEKAYLVPGDRVLVAPSQRVPGFVCAAFVSRKGTATVGWLAEAAVEAKPPPAAGAAEWIGTWKYLNATIKITRGKKPGTLTLEGDSFAQRYQSVNTGGFSGTDVPLQGNAIGFAMKQDETVPFEKAEQYDCALKLARLNDLMVVRDTGSCGGAGVYFGGYYRRK